MSDIKKYTFSQLGAAMASEGKNKDVQVVKYTDHVKAIEAKDKEIEELKAKAFKAAAALGKIKLEKTLKQVTI